MAPWNGPNKIDECILQYRGLWCWSGDSAHGSMISCHFDNAVTQFSEPYISRTIELMTVTSVCRTYHERVHLDDSHIIRCVLLSR